MPSIHFKKLVPHLIAVLIFLVVSLLFCKPGLEQGVVLNQGDVTSWQGMSHQAYQYKEQHGHLPLWVTNMFCGMPAYQIAMEGAWSPLSIFDKVIQLGLPQPFNFFFLACICFYFLCICLKIRPYAAIMGALAFAYCSYSPIIVTAGHNTKMLALGYAPAVIGATILVFDKKYLSGFALLALFTSLHIAQGHQQISYYLFLILIAISISYMIGYIRKKNYTHLFKASGLLIAAGIIAICVNSLVYFTAYDFSKYSKRGGQLVMDEKNGNKDKINDGKTIGLTKDYAFMWSYGKAETWSLMFPGVMGYGYHQAERDGDIYVFPQINENGPLYKYMNEDLPQFPAEQIAGQMNGALYWGNQPFTNGPVYLGAIICFLFIFGMFYLDNKHKWWILATSIIAILLSWGENFPAFNYFMFDYFPFYNKFRTPTMILVIPQILFPLAAALTIDKLMQNEDTAVWKKFKSAGITTLAAFILILSFYFTSDFSKENKSRTQTFNTIFKEGGSDVEQKLQELNEKYKPELDNQIYEGMISNFSRDPNMDAAKTSREFVSALRKERASLLLSDIFRSFILVLLAGGAIVLYLKNKINATILAVGLTVLSTGELLNFGTKYLNDKSFENKEAQLAEEFPITAADKMIMEDRDPNFRVFNTNSMEESKTSYYHKSIGGYHPAKLGIYDDLIAYQFKDKINMSVINMLNAKYFIQQQGNEKVAQLNPGALGNVWFVKGIQYVKGPANEMRAITNFNSKDTAVVDETYKSLISNFTIADSSESIKMSNFDNDAISYTSDTKNNHIAVFSEVFYKDWKAYIDGKPAEFFKANYVLRAMLIPSGKHRIDFKFEPSSFKIGYQLSNISSWFLMLILTASLIPALKKLRKQKDENSI